MTTGETRDLHKIAGEIRKKIIEVSHLTNTPHLGTCLSCVDILVSLYFREMRYDAANPSMKTRDRLILSKGHGAPALYPVLAHAGFFSPELVETCNTDGSLLGEHPLPNSLPGIEAATGSLGHGLSLGLGMALAARLNNLKYRVFVVLGDGECNEGSVWEAAMFASAQRLENVTAVIDFNKWQGTGRTKEILSIEPFAKKWESFGWDAKEVDGHSFEQLDRAFKSASDVTDRPSVIIAHTLKGKGVSFMEDDNNWHYRIPTAEEVKKSHEELDHA